MRFRVWYRQTYADSREKALEIIVDALNYDDASDSVVKLARSQDIEIDIIDVEKV